MIKTYKVPDFLETRIKFIIYLVIIRFMHTLNHSYNSTS